MRSALKNSGYDVPPSNTTINLAPADLRKECSGFDLPMALGILGAYGGLRNQPPEDALFVGELSLDGGLRGVRGALPIAVTARSNKIKKVILPEVNAREAAVVDGVSVYPVRSLMDVVNFLNTGNGIQPLMHTIICRSWAFQMFLPRLDSLTTPALRSMARPPFSPSPTTSPRFTANTRLRQG